MSQSYMHLLLTEQEKDYLEHNDPRRTSNSLTEVTLRPFLKIVSRQFVSKDVSPNVISLCSLLMLIQGWYWCVQFGETFPTLTHVSAIASLVIWFFLDTLDEIHAKETGNVNGMTEIFDSMCSTIGMIFIALISCKVFGVRDLHTTSYVVQCGQVALLTKHVTALKRGEMRYAASRGPGEAVLVFTFLLLARSFAVGVKDFDAAVDDLTRLVLPDVIVRSTSTHLDPVVFRVAVITHFALHLYLLKVILVDRKRFPSFSSTGARILLCALIVFLPSLVEAVIRHSFGREAAGADTTTVASVIADGLAYSVVTFDVLVSRLAGGERSLHPLIVMYALVSVVSVPLTFALAMLYSLTLLVEISHYTRLPILSVNRNVYVDGIFDMVHIGHVKHFERAAKLGTRLFVGVVDDEEATPYKRKPIMTHDERCEMVAYCKYVYKVIPHAPCTPGGLNHEFLKRHNIHIVGCGEEYEKPGDQWYGIPRSLGMTRVLPRTVGMSTSDLIKRIRTREDLGDAKL